jgi:hypothetical protein
MLFEDLTLQNVKDWSGLGALPIIGAFLWWFKGWLPKHLEQRGLAESKREDQAQARFDTLIATTRARDDELMRTIADQLEKERDASALRSENERQACAAQFRLIFEAFNTNLAELRQARATAPPSPPKAP